MSVINHEYKHTFIHVARCAGRSMERQPFVGGNGHATMRALNKDTPSDYLRWGFVRHPADRLLSCWSSFNSDAQHDVSDVTCFESFHDWVEALADEPERMWRHAHSTPQYAYLTLDGTPSGGLAVDFIGRFERLAAHWRMVCRMIGVDAPEMTHVGKTPHGRWQDAIPPGTYRLIEELYRADFALFGYPSPLVGTTVVWRPRQIKQRTGT